MLKLRRLHHENVPNKNRDSLCGKYSQCKYFPSGIFLVRFSTQGLSLDFLNLFLFCFLLLTDGAPPVKEKKKRSQLWLFVVQRAEAEAAALSLGFSLSKVLIRFAAQTYFCCLPPPHPSNPPSPSPTLSLSLLHSAADVLDLCVPIKEAPLTARHQLKYSRC